MQPCGCHQKGSIECIGTPSSLKHVFGGISVSLADGANCAAEIVLRFHTLDQHFAYRLALEGFTLSCLWKIKKIVCIHVR